MGYPISSREPLRLAFLMGAALTVVLAAPAYAQSTQAEAEPMEESPRQTGGMLDEIVVTAQKRSENLQKVGISVTAFSGEQLSRLGFNNATDITAQTPSVSIYQFSPSVSNINIRGVSQNDFADHLEGPVAVYQDEGYIGTSSAANVPIFDLARVEVLRGPQGTLFGRNSTGGLIHYVSAAPTDHFEGYLKATIGNFGTYRTEGAISGPLTEGLRARLSFTQNNSDGPYHNPIGKDPGNTKNFAIRGQIEADLGEKTKLRLIGKYYKDDSRGPAYSFGVSVKDPQGLGRTLGADEVGTFVNLSGGSITGACPGCNVNGYKETDKSPYTNSYDTPGFFKREIWGAQGRIEHEMGDVTLTSITDYLHLDKNIYYDVDASAYHFLNYGSDMDYDQVSQELRLNGKSGNLNWVTGAYYLHMLGDYDAYVDFDFSPYAGGTVCQGPNTPSCGIGGNTPLRFGPTYSLKSVSKSVFAQGEYEISPQFSLILGGRYTWEKKTFSFVHESTGVFPLSPTVVYNPDTDDDATRSFNNYALKAQLNYKPVEDVLLYASFSRGHKSGNWSATVFPPVLPDRFPHKQEVLYSYETGVKSKFLDGHATLNVSAFYYDYKNYQAFSFLNVSTFISNVPARIYGGEFEFRVAPFEGLELSLGGATLHGKAKEVALPNGDLTDRVMPGTPKLQLNGVVQYGWDIGEGHVTAQASGNYVGSRYHTIQNEPQNFEPKYATADLRLTYQFPNKQLELAGFVQNVTSTKYRLWALDVSTLGILMQVYAPPRTYGASIKYSF